MTVVIKAKKLLFVSAPKVACTSIKTALFEVENGFEFRPFHANGVFRHIHDLSVYPAAPFARINRAEVTDFLKLTIVRDPVRRFLSAYANRVVFYKELSEAQIGEAARREGVAVDPTLQEFIEHIETYRSISGSIRLHTDPLVHFLGNDAGFYDEVFDVRDLPRFDQRVAAHIGAAYSTPHLQTGGPKIDASELTSDELALIKERYEEDYAVYGRYMK